VGYPAGWKAGSSGRRLAHARTKTGHLTEDARSPCLETRASRAPTGRGHYSLPVGAIPRIVYRMRWRLRVRPRAAIAAAWGDAFLRRLARDSSWGLAATGIELVLSLAETTLVARTLGVTDYGRLALVMASVATIKQFLDVRAWEGATRYLAEFLQRGERALALATLKVALGVDAVVAVTAYGTALLLAGLISTRWLSQPDLHGPILWYSLTLILTAVNATAEAVLRVCERFRDLALRAGAQAAWHLGLVAFAVLMGARMRGLIAAYLMSDLLGAVLLVWLAGRQVRADLWAARGAARLSTLRPYRAEMLWFTIHTAARATLKLNRQLDLLVLGHFRAPADVGYYRVARRLGTSAVELSNPFYYVIFPEFARAWAGIPRQFGRLVAHTAGVAAVGAIPGVLLGVWLAPVLIRLWVGSAYLPAVGPFRVVMLGMGLAVATFWGTPAALGSGRPGLATSAVACGVLVNLALLFWLARPLGAMGAAIGLLGSYVAYGLVISVGLARALRPTAAPGLGGGPARR